MPSSSKKSITQPITQAMPVTQTAVVNPSGPIDHAGFILNLGGQGFQNCDLIPEGIDNSLDAGSSKVRIEVDENKTLILADNGTGMSKEKLQSCFRACTRTASSTDKQGKFGMGANVMHSLLSGNQKTTKCFTNALNQNEDGSETYEVSHIDLNWPIWLKNNHIDLKSEFASSNARKVWEKYAIDAEKSGVVDIIPLCDPIHQYIHDQVTKVDENIASIAKIVNIPNNTPKLIFDYSRAYTQSIKEGAEITIKVADKKFTLVPVDLLAVSSSGKKSVQPMVLYVWWKPAERKVRVYSKVKNDWVYRDYNPESIKKNVKNPKKINQKDKNYPPTEQGFVSVGILSIEQAYDPELLDTKKYPEFEGGTGLGGVYIKRNKKIIHHIPRLITGGGARPQRETRTIVTFQASDDFDNLFGVEINKSRISNIEKHLLEEIFVIHDKFAPKLKEDSSDSDTVASRTPAAKDNTPAPLFFMPPAPKKPVVRKVVGNVAQVITNPVKTVVLDNTITQPIATVVSSEQVLAPFKKADAESTSISSESGEETEIVGPATQNVSATVRITPQCKYNCIDLFMKLSMKNPQKVLEEKRARASKETEEGLSKIVKALMALDEILDQA